VKLFALCVEVLLALAKALGLFASAKQANDERAAGAAAQRAKDLSDDANRVQKAARADADFAAGKLPDPHDRDSAS